jgi:LCP family protein required for cell wall assembly
LIAAGLAALVTVNLCLLAGLLINNSPGWTSAFSGTSLDRPLSVLRTAVAAAAAPAEPPPATPQPGQASATPEPAKGVVTILLLGIDARPNQRGEPTRSDAMMLLRANFDEGTVHLLSLPRDMWVPMPLEERGITEGQINTAYFFGERYNLPGGGPAVAVEMIELNFGFPVDHYAVIDFDGFVRLVDALGGIDVDVPTAIYDDIFPTDDYGITTLDIPAGRQHLDGLTALRYARTRHQDSDFDRVRRQQAVLVAIAQKAISLDAVTKLPELIRIAGDSFQTDMTIPEMLSYAVAGQGLDPDNVETFVPDHSMLIGIKGDNNSSVYLPDQEAMQPLITEFLE